MSDQSRRTEAPMSDELPNLDLRAMAQAKIQAGELPAKPMGTFRAWDAKGKYSGPCTVCEKILPPADRWRIADYPGEPEMHHPVCFNAWCHAVGMS